MEDMDKNMVVELMVKEFPQKNWENMGKHKVCSTESRPLSWRHGTPGASQAAEARALRGAGNAGAQGPGAGPAGLLGPTRRPERWRTLAK
jgi:hypothetical protein